MGLEDGIERRIGEGKLEGGGLLYIHTWAGERDSCNWVLLSTRYDTGGLRVWE